MRRALIREKRQSMGSQKSWTWINDVTTTRSARVRRSCNVGSSTWNVAMSIEMPASSRKRRPRSDSPLELPEGTQNSDLHNYRIIEGFLDYTWGNLGFPGGSVAKNPPANAEDMVSIPESRWSHGGRNGNPLQYSCLGNPMERGAWQATAHKAAKS